MEFPGGHPPPIPEGWRADWSHQYHQWFYVHLPSGASQWHPPPPPNPTYAAQPQHAQPQYAQPQYAQSQDTRQYSSPLAQAAAPAKSGIMGKLGSLEPKAQTALAVGGSLAAGAFVGHEIEEFVGKRPHSPSHHHVLGTVAGLMGAGALGSKLFGGKKHSANSTPSPPAVTAYPPPQLQQQQHAAPVYHTPSPGPPAYTSGPAAGLGGFVAGGAMGAAGALGVSNMIHHQPSLGGGMAPFQAAPAHSGPRLIIHAATYADLDIAEKVKSRVTPNQTFSIEKLKDEFGDPWPEVERKMFNILYQYGDRPMEVWAGSTSSEMIDIRNEALANARMSFINKDPGRIICLIWGQQSILTKERVAKLENDGELDCTSLGDGGFYPWEPKNLICYYRTTDGGVGVGHGREGGTLRLPWNPLAKWS